jgi:hypothetical protein
MFVLRKLLALFLNLKTKRMNTVESIFKNETNITEVVELFRMAFGSVADILDNPSCIGYSVIRQD